jgi:DNA-nicking Smr family endonuclease
MARRKRKKRPSTGQKPAGQKKTAFNPVLKEKVGLKKRAPAPSSPIDLKGEGLKARLPEDRRVFLEAMRHVHPLKQGKKIIIPEPNSDLRPAHPAPDDEMEGLAYLSDLVNGSAEMDITFSDEYIQGSVQGFNRKLMQKLKKGHFPIQDYVDLHGLTKREAEIKVRDFLVTSAQQGLRCVLIIHGRGLNSENNIPILKERLPVWLNRGPAKKIVLAFSTARPYDGGTGAIYILLRRRTVL